MNPQSNLILRFITWTKRLHSLIRSFSTSGLKKPCHFILFVRLWKTDTLRNFFFTGKNAPTVLKNPITALRFLSFLSLQVLLHRVCACIYSTAVAQLHSLCWHLDTEPMTWLSHSGLQLEQVRTAHSWRFRHVTIGTAGAHLVRQRLAHRDGVVVMWIPLVVRNNDTLGAVYSEIRGRITLNLRLPSTRYVQNRNQVLILVLQRTFGELVFQVSRGINASTCLPHIQLIIEVLKDWDMMILLAFTF